MIGEPKYAVGDKVKIKVDDNWVDAEIGIVDKYGTFFNPHEVSYDVWFNFGGERILYKHIPEDYIRSSKED